MKKILLSVLTIALVAVVAAGATQALFSDSEESTGNTFTAGTLDLTVDGVNDPDVVSLTIDNVIPGYSDYYTWELRNAGSVSGQPSITLSTVDNYENDCIEPETEAGDTSCGATEGELGSKLYVWLQWSNDGGSSWNRLRCNGNYGNNLLNSCAGKTVGFGDFSGVGPGDDTALPVLDAGDSVIFRLHPWWHLTSTDNVAQGDSSEFDILFSLEQN